MIYKDIDITVDSNDLSSSLRGIEMAEGQKTEPGETMGDDWENFEPGVRVMAFSAQFEQSYASGGVDSIISALMDGDTFTVVVTPTSSAVGTSNPSFTGTYMIENYQRFTGEWGTKAFCQVDFALAEGSTGAVRATS